MLHRSQQVTINEHELPATAGSFNLKMNSQRTIVGIVSSGGKTLLLAQGVDGSSDQEFSFEAVESGKSVSLSNDFDEPTTYLGSYQADGKLLHLFGVKTVRSRGGACGML